MGSAGRLLSATAPQIQQNPPSLTAPRWAGAGAGRGAKRVSEGSLLNEGLLAKEKKKILQVFCLKIQPGTCFPSHGAVPSLAAPHRAPRAALPEQSPVGAGVTGSGTALATACSVPGGFRKPTEAPAQDSGWLLPQKRAFPWVVFPVSPRRCSRRGG